MLDTINVEQCREYFLAGAANLQEHKEYSNELNVFPVPDGDTGTNMSLTILSAAKEVEAIDKMDMDSLCKAISLGSLKGARGNSGVILSQLLRGMTKGFQEYDEITTSVLAQSFQLAVESAYKAVMKPKEGTILTVAKGIAQKAAEIAPEVTDILEFTQQVVQYGNEVLDSTPEMLPVLKEAGVVDSGGKGLMTILEGVFASMKGEKSGSVFFENQDKTQDKTEKKPSEVKANVPEEEIKYGYCTEFIILLNQPLPSSEQEKLKAFLLSIGDSLVMVAQEDIVKIHVHTNHPGQAFEKALEYGELSHIKVDNMREEHRSVLIQKQESTSKQSLQQESVTDTETSVPRKAMGVIAVSIGEGMNGIFKDLGVDYVVEGGQTMNPSTDDMLNAIAQVNADTVFIFPNNKNIVLAANQAKELEKEKQVIVIPTTTVPQGISAMISYAPESSVEDNENNFNEMRQTVATGQVTYAVRDTSINGLEIHKGDIMAMDDDGIQNVGSEQNAVTLELLAHMVQEDSELICIYYGEETKKEQAEQLGKQVEEQYPECDVEIQYGGQPVYYYVLSVE